MAEDKKIISGTDVLIKAMEDLGSSDDQHIMVLIRDSNGDFIWHSNMTSIMDRLGMLTFALIRQKYLVTAPNEED